MSGLSLDLSNFNIDVSSAGLAANLAGLALVRVTNSTIRDLDLSKTGPDKTGIGLELQNNSSDITVTNVTATNRQTGAQIFNSHNNTIELSNFSNASHRGIYLIGDSAGNTICRASQM